MCVFVVRVCSVCMRVLCVVRVLYLFVRVFLCVIFVCVCVRVCTVFACVFIVRLCVCVCWVFCLDVCVCLVSVYILFDRVIPPIPLCVSVKRHCVGNIADY